MAAETRGSSRTGGGAVALAGVLYGHVDSRDKTTVALITGGNIDTKVLDQALRYAA